MKNHDEKVSLEEHFYNANLEESRRRDEEDYFRKSEQKQAELNLEAFLKSQNDTHLKSLEKQEKTELEASLRKQEKATINKIFKKQRDDR